MIMIQILIAIISFEDNASNNKNNDIGYLTIKTVSDIEINKNFILPGI